MIVLRTISIVTLSVMLVTELNCFIKDLKRQSYFGSLLTWIVMIAFTFIPYIYIVLK